VSIGTKITFAAVTFVLITAAAVGFAVYSGSSALLVKQQIGNLGDQNHIAATRLTSRIEALRQDLQFLAGTPPIQGLVRTHGTLDGIDTLDGSTETLWRSRLSIIFSQFLYAKPNYLQVRYIGIADGGRELVRVERRSDGTVQVITGSGLQQKGQHTYFRETSRLKAGEIYLSEVTLNREQGKISEPKVAVMRASLPIFSSTGSLFGMVIINMDFLSVLENVTNEKHFYISNDQGDYLLHNNPSLSFGFEYGWQHRLQNDYPELAKLFSKDSPFDELTLQQGAGLDEEAISFYKAFFDPLHPQRFIGFALSASYQQVVAESISVRNRSIVLALFLISLGGGLAWLFSRFLTRPLHQITLAAKQMSEDNFDISLPVKAGGELGLLARGFDHMVQQINERGEVLHIEREAQRKLIIKLQEAREQLLQNEKMAAIGQLAAGVAHEINNPIGYINSNLGTLKNYTDDLIELTELYQSAEASIGEAHQQLFEPIKTVKARIDINFIKQDLPDLVRESQEGAERVRQIVQDLKEFSHVDEAEWQQADLHSGLDSTLNIAHNEIKYKAEVVKEYSDLPLVQCIASQINQVFMNLLVNAAHAIEKQGVITLRTGHNDSEVWVEISDTGMGIPPEKIKHIFEPFYTTKAVGIGTGLGLSLSYSIIKKHHGQITVNSEPGNGTSFTIYLPIKQPSKDQPDE